MSEEAGCGGWLQKEDMTAAELPSRDGASGEKRLRVGERLDDLQRDGLRIIQHPGRFCFGMDAVLLSDFAKAHPGEKVLDLGTGTGVIPLLMSARYPAAHYTALEIQEESADMARRSVIYNGLAEKIRILQGDLKEAFALPLLGGTEGRWDVVTMNPPYMKVPSGAANKSVPMSVARHELCCDLDDVLQCAARALRSKGRVYLCYRPQRMAELLAKMSRFRLEPKRLRLVYPRSGREANLVLVEGIRDASAELRVLPPLLIYDENGHYNKEVYQIYGGNLCPQSV